MAKQVETERDIILQIEFPFYGTQDQRLKSAGNIKRLLEVTLHTTVNVMVKVGNEWEIVKRGDRNAGEVDGGDV